MTGIESKADRRGFIFAVGCYVMWGFLPLYFHILKGISPVNVLAHRMLWSMVLLLCVVLVLRRAGSIFRAARGRTLLLLMGSASLIALNWLIYIWAVQQGHVLEASMGYFMNPLLNVALGIIVLGERLRRWQGVAIGLAAVGVLVMVINGGGAIGVSLGLALTFGFYGLIRKVVSIDALGGLTIETMIFGPVSGLWLLYAATNGETGFGVSLGQDGLLLLAGVITAVPLLLFSAAARLMPLSSLGLLQYITPTLQFILALSFGEKLEPVHLVTFALIWIGCALYGWDSYRGARSRAEALPA